eukprot:5497067-Amphidinium_carterae.3
MPEMSKQRVAKTGMTATSSMPSQHQGCAGTLSFHIAFARSLPCSPTKDPCASTSCHALPAEPSQGRSTV